MTSDAGGGPALHDLVEVAGVLWPAELLERAPQTALEALAGTFAGDGACRVCDAELGGQPWVAVVDAAAGPFGAWAASGGLAHPDCATQTVVWGVAGQREDPVPTVRCGSGVQLFPIPEPTDGWEDGPVPSSQQIPFPTLSLVPAVDAFLIGVDPRGTRVEDKLMRRFLDLGWHRLRRSVTDGVAVDMGSPQASIVVTGHQVTLELADGGAWEFEVDDPEVIASFGCVVVLIGVTSAADERLAAPWLYPGPLYAVVYPRDGGVTPKAW